MNGSSDRERGARDGSGDGSGDTNVDTDRRSPSPIVADLHVHTTASDGTLPTSAVPAAARRAGLDCVAITDHDRINPEIDAPVVRRRGVRIVRGIELRVDAGFEQLDLLGYAVEPTDALVEEIDRLQRDRHLRARRMIDAVEAFLNVTLELDPHDGIGRPHVARAIEESSAPYDYADAFAELIGDDGPCYIARDVTPLTRGMELLGEACSFTSLAHPFRYEDLDRALDIARSLDGIERWYPYGRAVDLDRIDRLVVRTGLLPTGGSDAHDGCLGVSGVPPGSFAPIRERLPDPCDEQG